MPLSSKISLSPGWARTHLPTFLSRSLRCLRAAAVVSAARRAASSSLLAQVRASAVGLSARQPSSSTSGG
eukprot:6152593-Alexandrium_andersonii.AAC.1